MVKVTYIFYSDVQRIALIIEYMLPIRFVLHFVLFLNLLASQFYVITTALCAWS